MKGERIGKTRWYKLLCDRCGEVIGKYRPDLVVVGAAKCDECTKREAIALLREFPVPGAENSQEAWVHYINAIREWDDERRKFLDGEEGEK